MVKEIENSEGDIFWYYVHKKIQRPSRIKMLANACILYLIICGCGYSELYSLYIWFGESLLAILMSRAVYFPKVSSLKVTLVLGNRSSLLEKIGISLIIARTWQLIYILIAYSHQPSEMWTRSSYETWGTILIDTTQMLFWTSFNFSITWEYMFCFIECTSQCIRLFSLRNSSFHPHADFISYTLIATVILCSMLCVVSLSLLNMMQRESYAWHRQVARESNRKHDTVQLLSKMVLAPVHKITQAVQSVAVGVAVAGNKAWTKRIVRAANQVSLYSNNFLMLFRLEEDRFKFGAEKVVHLSRLFRSVCDQMPSLDPAQQPILKLQMQLDVDSVGSDSKALMFIVQNCLTHAVNTTRRRSLELSGQFRRKVAYSEFAPINVSSRYLAESLPYRGDRRRQLLQIVITFAQYDPLQIGGGQFVSSPLSPVALSTSATDKLRFQQLEELCCAKDSVYDVQVASILERASGNPASSAGDSLLQSESIPRSRDSSILLTAQQMLESCLGSLRLIEMPMDFAAAASLSGWRRRGKNSTDPPPMSDRQSVCCGGENMIVIIVPCVPMARPDPPELLGTSRRYADESGHIAIQKIPIALLPTSSFQLGFLVTDNELCKYGIKLFKSCNVHCIRITMDHLRTVDKNTFSAIVTDSLTNYSQLRMRGFSGKVVVMSTEAVYIDGKSSGGQILDYALSVPCDISEVLDLIQALSKENARRPTVALNFLGHRIYGRIEKILIKRSHIPVLYGFWQFAKLMWKIIAAIQLEVAKTMSWLHRERLNAPQSERELGHHLNMTRTGWGMRTFSSPVEVEYRLWKVRFLCGVYLDVGDTGRQETSGGICIDTLKSIPYSYRCLVRAVCFFSLSSLVWEGIMLAVTAFHVKYLCVVIAPFVSAALVGGGMYVTAYVTHKTKFPLDTYWKITGYVVTMASLLNTATLLLRFDENFNVHLSHNIVDCDDKITEAHGLFNGTQIIYYALSIFVRAQCMWMLPFDLRVIFALLVAQWVKVCCSVALLTPLLRVSVGAWRTVILLLMHLAMTSFFISYEGDGWMRRLFQSKKKGEYSQQFLDRGIDLVWRELRHPLRTLLDYEEEYLRDVAGCCLAHPLRLTPLLMKHLTTYRLANVKLVFIRNILRIKEILDAESFSVDEQYKRWNRMGDVPNYLRGFGSVFESQEPVCIRIYMHIEPSVPKEMRLDGEFLQCLLAHILMRAVDSIKLLTNTEPGLSHAVHEVVMTVRVVPSVFRAFLHVEIMDSGREHNSAATANESFQESICRLYAEKMGGHITRRTIHHSVFHNVVSFSLPVLVISDNSVGNSPPPLVRGCSPSGALLTHYCHCGKHHCDLLDKHLQWHAARDILGSGSGAPAKSRLFREGRGFSRNVMCILQTQADNDMISRNFRLKGWKCVSIGAQQHIETVSINMEFVDAVVIDEDLNYNHIDAWNSYGLVQRFRETYPGVVLVCLTIGNKRSGMHQQHPSPGAEGIYDVMLQRPLVDKDMDYVAKACSAKTINALLWCEDC